MGGEIPDAAYRDFVCNSVPRNNEAIATMIAIALILFGSGFGLLWTGAFDFYRRY